MTLTPRTFGVNNGCYPPDISKPNGRRIINVTHQIPFEIHHQGNLLESASSSPWYFSPRRNHEAMNDGIHSLSQHKNWDIIHIGWIGQIIWHSGLDDETTNTNDSLTKQDKYELKRLLWDTHHCIPLFLDTESVNGHYDGYCKTST